VIHNILSDEQKLMIAEESNNLLNEKQKSRFGRMLYSALVDIRLAAGDTNTELAVDLADAFHNLPNDLFGLSIWDAEYFRSNLEYYHEKYSNAGSAIFTKYLDEFDSICPDIGR